MPGIWRLNRAVVWALVEVRSLALLAVPKGGVAAEIGVWRGDFSEQILRVTSPKRLHLVDPWTLDESHGACGYDQAVPPTVDDVRRRFANDSRVTVHREFSDAFLENLEPGSLDWIYVDGDHLYEAVLSDLKGCWRVLKPGGVVVGDDFHWLDPAGQPSVAKAVEFFCQQRAIRYELVGTQFVLKKIGDT